MFRLVPLSLALVLAASTIARAEERPSASLLSTAASPGVGEGLSGAVDRLLRSRIDALDVVNVQGSVALDVAEVQLALGCVGETTECLSQVAEQIGVEVLILPNLDRVGEEVVLSVGRFDSRDGQLRRVLRRVRGEQAETEILDAIEGALRELFDLPLPEEDPVELDPLERPVVTPPAESPDLALPAITLGTGVAVLGAAILTGVLFQGEADAYAIPPTSLDDVAERQGHRRSAEDLALATNVLAITGGVIAAAGAVWLLVELLGGGGGGEPQARITPLFGRDVAGIAVSGGMP